MKIVVYKFNFRAHLIAKYFVFMVLLCQLPGFAVEHASLKTFTHPQAAFTFQCPATATTTLGNSDIGGSRKDTVTVHWKGGYLAVQLIKTPLENAIDHTEALIEEDNGKYYRPGRFDTKGEAKSIKFGHLSGLYGVSMCGISDASGFHAAAGSCLSGFLSDGKQTAYFETDGIFPTEFVIKQIFPTFRFHN